jgi:hypothetical protein
MPDITESNQPVRTQDVSDVVINVNVIETPVTSMLPKDTVPMTDFIRTFQMKKLPNVGHKGIPDKKDAGGGGGVPRIAAQSLIQKVRQEYSVGDLVNMMGVPGISSEEEEQQMDAMILLKQQIEQRILSDADFVQGASEDGYETRGLVKWYSNTQGSLYPVPVDARTPAAANGTGAIASFTEESMATILSALVKARGSTLDLMGVGGVDMLDKIATWTVRDPNVSSSIASLRTFNADSKDKRLIRAVMFLDFHQATVKLMHSNYILRARDGGAKHADSDRTLLFFEQRYTKLNFARKPRLVVQKDEGGGPRGFVDAVFRLLVENPLTGGYQRCTS